MSKVLFTADTHLGHGNLISHGHRPMFDDVDDMNDSIVRRWNMVVNDDDIVYHVGDFSWMNRLRTEAYLAQLKGRIILIRGNHDHDMAASTRKMFEAVHDYLELKLKDQPMIVLFHFPIQSWNKIHYGSIHLHGHSHGSMPMYGKRMDVGVDCHAFAPITLDEVLAKMAFRQIQSMDHHQPKETPAGFVPAGVTG